MHISIPKHASDIIKTLLLMVTKHTLLVAV